MSPAVPTVLIVPGLRDHVAQHWQTLLAAELASAGKPVRSAFLAFLAVKKLIDVPSLARASGE